MAHDLSKIRNPLKIGDISVSITNASYNQDSSGNKKIVFDINYSAKPIAVGRSLVVVLLYQINSISGISLATNAVGTLDEIKTTVQSSGIKHFEVPIVTNETQVIISAFVWDRAGNPLSSLVDKSVTLQVIPLPEQLYMRMVFEDATPIADKIQSVNFILKIEDVGLLNSWWAQSHERNPDPKQNLVKVFEGLADDTLDLVTLQQAKDELLNMISQVEPEPEPEPEPPPEDVLVVIHYSDNTTDQFVLTTIEASLLSDVSQNDNRWFVTFNTASPNESQGLGFVQKAIAQRLASMPTNEITPDMVRITMGNFTLSDTGQIEGSVVFIATDKFNPFYYNTAIHTIMQVKSLDGEVQFLTENGTVKERKINELNFTLTERDETISYLEKLKIPLDQIKIEIFVWKSIAEPTAFSFAKSQNIEVDIGLEPCQTGFHRFNGVCVCDDCPPKEKQTNILTKVLGGVAILGSIALLATRRR